MGNRIPEEVHYETKKRNFNKADWSQYTELIEQRCETLGSMENQSVDKVYKQYSDIIQDVADLCIPRKILKKNTKIKMKPCWWDPQCNKMIAKRRLALHNLKKKELGKISYVIKKNQRKARNILVSGMLKSGKILHQPCILEQTLNLFGIN